MGIKEDEEKALVVLIKNRDVKGIVRYFFDEDLLPSQEKIVRAIAFKESRRIVISAYTRYGKSWSVSFGVLLYILFNKNKRIVLIAPRQDQTSILRNYIAEFMLRSEKFVDLLDIEATGADRIKREVSKRRITFKNGCDLKVLSAEGSADRLMGWGGDLIIIDESCLIDYEIYRQKIHRMLGDSPDSALVEIGNPWHRNGQMYKHWCDPNFMKLHIGWEVGVSEGRTSREFIREQEPPELTDYEFTVLYEAHFPEEAEDQLIRLKWIEAAEKREFELKDPNKVNGIDVAEMGRDLTVITKGLTKSGNWILNKIHSWGKKDTMQTVGLIIQRVTKDEKEQIDAIGTGKGVYDRLKEIGYDAVDIKVSRSVEGEENKTRFLNQKSEFYWRMREIFQNGDISIVKELIKTRDYKILKDQLLAMRYEFTSGSKIKIIDPLTKKGTGTVKGKSPDFADSLMFMCGAYSSRESFGIVSAGKIFR